jgi:hypothetical protein
LHLTHFWLLQKKPTFSVHQEIGNLRRHPRHTASTPVLQTKLCFCGLAPGSACLYGRFHESDLLRHVFETMGARCKEEGWVGVRGFAVAASVISPDVLKQKQIFGASM